MYNLSTRNKYLFYVDYFFFEYYLQRAVKQIFGLSQYVSNIQSIIKNIFEKLKT